MLGLMQDWSLTLDKLLDHARLAHPERQIISRSIEGPIVRETYAELWARAKQVSHALAEDGVEVGHRVATLAWNTGRHMELWYGAMGIGAVVHTLNPRLFPEQLAWIANHGGAETLAFDLTFLPLVAKLAPMLPAIRRYIALTDAAHLPAGVDLPGLKTYEEWIAGRPLDTRWGQFDENTAAGLCYTSGTTGHPKGVLYSHRSNMLTTMAAAPAHVFGLSAADRLLAVVPMFHANSWCLPFLAALVGGSLIMPGARLDGASIYELIEGEGATMSAAVPTVWLGLLAHMREHDLKLTRLNRVLIGGAAVPERVLRAFEADGIEVIHAWGMTEMSPMGSVCVLRPEDKQQDVESRLRLKMKQGRAPFTVEMKLVDDAGARLPHDGTTAGRLFVKGPAVARSYFRYDGARNERGDILDDEGFFDTGDIATIDPAGYMQITDRAKDVIKSGGEWISSIDIENLALGAPGVACAAVIAAAHPKWDERPLLIVEPAPGAAIDRAAVLAWLDGKMAKWQLPDDVVIVEKIPLGATGKVNKVALREQFKGYVLPTIEG